MTTSDCQWKCALSLDAERQPDSGSAEQLTRAIRDGADLRVGTAFRHNEHIDPSSDRNELIQEVMDFRITYLLDDRWAAGIENLRMPVALPDGFAHLMEVIPRGPPGETEGGGGIPVDDVSKVWYSLL